MIVKAAPSEYLQNYLPVTVKTISDRFKKVLVDHHDEQQKKFFASKIVEVRGEREELLDNLAFDVNELEEKLRKDHNECTQLDKHLRAAGEKIRRDSANRRKSG